ncbi:alpha/beta hydrolase family esterase [Corynebacterium kutscheri]|uniref:alpha/beta hydrolase family esterase n=1 Tax=Corynebacterium kutscheri TaxID=35755 RepID=UPI00130EF84B|nr:poly(3-hydroxyalkanoate) depolymerase [Corynebacterium kutscheri]
MDKISIADRTALVIPASTTSHSVLIYLHGSAQSPAVARRFTDHSFETLSNQGVTICYPAGVHRHWNDARIQFNEKTRQLGIDDVSFLSELAQHFEGQRVLGVGFSNGGHMLFRLLHDAPGLLSQAAIIGATLPAPDNFLSHTHNWQPTPILLMHGTADPISPFYGGTTKLVTGHDRGNVLSFSDTANYFVQLNQAPPPVSEETDNATIQRYGAWVETWALKNVGHYVPTLNPPVSKLLGPAPKGLVAADILTRFFNC